MSKCPKCVINSYSFEVVENSPRGSNFKLWFVQCVICKSPIGAMEYFNSSVKMDALERKLSSKLDEIDNMIRQLYSRIK